jgi:hypothetical protein
MAAIEEHRVRLWQGKIETQIECPNREEFVVG